MKLAIHNRDASFSKRWINYCEEKNINYKIVDCYKPDIINQLEDCNVLMWHFSQDNYKDMLFAKQLIFSVEVSGKKVFPDFNTCWHFDDKVGQKYLLEAIDAPLVPTWVFFSKKEALDWVQKTDFPLVFKLRCGAGSSNVRLVKNKAQANQLIKKAFNRGFSQFNRFGYLKERLRKYLERKDNIGGVFKGVARLLIPTELAKMRSPEKGYVYFQKFIPNNDHDIRVVVIGNRAFAIKRMNRKNDFRASGSGNVYYNKEFFGQEIIQTSFEIAKRINSQCLAFDYIFQNFKPLIVEISYGFSQKGYEDCPGFWDQDLNWHPGKFNPQEWIIENLIQLPKQTL